MEEERKKFSAGKFACSSGKTRYYYLVTGTSGYFSADFRYPGLPGGGRGMLVVPEVRTDSANFFLPHAFPQSIPEPEE